MRGPDLAKLLREIGFENIRTHMTVLDDADLMMVEARLSAQGLRRQPAADEAATPSATPKKKSLTTVVEDTEVAPEPPAPAPSQKRELKELPRKAPAKLPAKRTSRARSCPAGTTS